MCDGMSPRQCQPPAAGCAVAAAAVASSCSDVYSTNCQLADKFVAADGPPAKKLCVVV